MFYVSILRLAPCFLLLTPQKRGHLGVPGRSSSGSDAAGSSCSHSRAGPPPVPPVHLEKALFYRHVQELDGLVCFFGTIDKRSNFFPVILTHVYLSERLFLLTAEQHTGWLGRVDLWMHAFRPHIATKMECGNMLCTSDWEMTKKSRSKGWYIIYIYQCYYS